MISRFSFFLIFIFLLFSCSFNLKSISNNEVIEGVGDSIYKDFQVDMFRYLEIDVDASVEIIQSDSLNIRVEGQQNIIDNLEIIVSNSHLKIKFKKSNFKYKSLKIVIYVPSIQRIVLNGSGFFDLKSWGKEDRLHIINNGSADFQIGKLSHIKHFNVDLNGSGSMLVVNESELINSVHCILNGTGNINLEKLQISNSHIKLNGSGNIQLGQMDQLNAEIVGSGNVTYSGTPKIHKSIVGSGTLHQK